MSAIWQQHVRLVTPCRSLLPFPHACPCGDGGGRWARLSKNNGHPTGGLHGPLLWLLPGYCVFGLRQMPHDRTGIGQDTAHSMHTASTGYSGGRSDDNDTCRWSRPAIPHGQVRFLYSEQRIEKSLDAVCSIVYDDAASDIKLTATDNEGRSTPHRFNSSSRFYNH